MTKQDLSTRLAEEGRHVPPLAVYRIEAQHRRVDADDLAALARVFAVQVVALLDEPACTACHGAPPPGFTCNTCGTGDQP